MRVGLVGCGGWGRHLLRDLCGLGCEVEVVARSPASVERAREGGASAIVGEHEQLGDVAGVLVATPDATHAAVARELLEREVPIFCQKPLTLDPESAERLVADARGRLFVMELWRYHPGVEALRDLVRSGELGKLQGLRSLRWGWGLKRGRADATYHLLPHDLSLTTEILGSLPPARSARAAIVGGQAVELLGLLGTGDGPWVELDASAARFRRRREVRLLFEDGVAWFDEPYAEAIGIARPAALGSEPEWRPIDGELPMLRQLRAFVDHLAGGPAPKSSGEDALEGIRRLAELRELAGLPPAGVEN